MHSTLFCQIFTFSKDIKFSIGTSFFNGRGHLTVLSIWVQFLHSSNRLCDSVTLSILSDIVNPKTACNVGENVKNCCINFRFLKILNFLLSLSLLQIWCFFCICSSCHRTDGVSSWLSFMNRSKYSHSILIVERWLRWECIIRDLQLSLIVFEYQILLWLLSWSCWAEAFPSENNLDILKPVKKWMVLLKGWYKTRRSCMMMMMDLRSSGISINISTPRRCLAPASNFFFTLNRLGWLGSCTVGKNRFEIRLCWKRRNLLNFRPLCWVLHGDGRSIISCPPDIWRGDKWSIL